ncbi:hypothetical protein OIU74_007623, partial [Salix koriyanagi]
MYSMPSSGPPLWPVVYVAPCLPWTSLLFASCVPLKFLNLGNGFKGIFGCFSRKNERKYFVL